MKWTLAQCQSQAAGIKRLEDIGRTRKLTPAEKDAIKWGKAYYRAYGCKGTVRRGTLPSTVSNVSGVSPSTLAPSTPEQPMSLLSLVGDVVAGATGSGRANTVGGTAAAESPGLLSTLGSIAGTIIGSAIGTPAVGNAVGTTLGTLAESSPTANGRAIAPVRLEAGGDIVYPEDSAVTVSGGRRRLPATAKVRRLVHLVGVVNAASILGLAVPLTAMIAVRPYRRRGISAASLRITRRTIRQVNAITHSLSRIKPCRKR